MDTPARNLIFISYSHEDRVWLDRLLVFLKPYLRRGVVEVWADPWIRVGDRWRREISGAIQRVNVAVLLTSPHFLASDFIVEEEVPPLIEAVEGGEVTLACVPVSACAHDVPLPVGDGDVLLTDYQWCRPPTAPLDLLGQAERNQALVQIAGTVADAARESPAGRDPSATGGREPSRPSVLPVQPVQSGEPDRLGTLHGVPALPTTYLERRELLDELRRSLLYGHRRSIGITGAPLRLGLHGQGGIGKSVTAQALVRDEAVRSAFPDGIVWLTVGQDPDHGRLVEETATALGEELPPVEDAGEARAELSRRLSERSLLLVLDDVWDADDARALDVTGARSRVLVTTRDASVLTGLRAVEKSVEVLRREAALELLAGWVGVPADDLPGPARRVAEEAGGLPLALSLAGAMVREGAPWSELAEALEAGRLSFLDHPHGSVFSSMRSSVEALSPSDAARYRELSVFPEDVAVPESTVRRLWARTGGLDAHEAGRVVGVLHSRNLLRLDEAGGRRSVGLHDLQRDYLRLTVEDPAALHRQLLDAHEDLLSTDRPPGTPGWHTLPPDTPYLWQRIADHLVAGDRSEELRSLFLDTRWLEAKLRATGLAAVLEDFDHLPGDDDLRQVRQALRLAGHAVTRDPSQLAGQLLGRLPRGEDGERTHLRCAVPLGPGAWLRPAHPSLTPPGGPQLATLTGHEGWVHAVAVTADGRRVISGSSDATVRVWDWARGEELLTLRGHRDGVVAVAATPDGRRAVSGSEDGTLKVWDLETGDELATVRSDEGRPRGVGLTPDGRRALSGCEDGTLRVWSLQGGEELALFRGHEGPVLAVAVTGDGRRAVTASRDWTLKVWDLERREEILTLTGHEDVVKAVAVTPDGRRAVSGSDDRTVKVWDLERGEELDTLVGHQEDVRSVSVAPDGVRAVSGSGDRTVKLWDLERGEELTTLTGHDSGVEAVAFMPDGSRAVSASNDWTLKVWELGRTEVPMVDRGHVVGVNAVAATPDGRLAVSGSDDGVLRIWDLVRGGVTAALRGHSLGVGTVAVASDGTRVVSGSFDGTIRLWDPGRGEQVAMLTGHRKGVTAVAVPEERWIAVSGSLDGTVRIWDLEERAEVATLTGHGGWVQAVAVTPDARLAVSGSFDRTLRVWDLERREAVGILTGHEGGIRAVAVVPDGRRAVSGSDDRTVKLWDLEREEAVATLTGHEGAVLSVAVTPDGKRAVSASLDRTVKVWDLEREKVAATFRCDGAVRGVAVLRDGETVVAGSAVGGVHCLTLEDSPPARPR